MIELWKSERFPDVLYIVVRALEGNAVSPVMFAVSEPDGVFACGHDPSSWERDSQNKRLAVLDRAELHGLINLATHYLENHNVR